MHELVGEKLASELVETLDTGQEGVDVLVWTPTTNSKFTTKSAWEVIRVKMSRIQCSDLISHHLLPKHVLICMRKAVFNCLSVDS